MQPHNTTSERDSAPITAASQASPCAQPDQCTVLDLTVGNHPGVMSHVCGLFSRRAFNVEAILCMPLDHGLSRILLLVREDERLAQMTAQAEKLRDVHEVRACPELHSLFGQLQKDLNWTEKAS